MRSLSYLLLALMNLASFSACTALLFTPQVALWAKVLALPTAVCALCLYIILLGKLGYGE